MQELYEKGNKDAKPNFISFSCVLNAYSKQRDDIVAAERALSLLQRMKELYQKGNDDAQPDSMCYTTVISALARSGDPTAPQKAEELLQEMQASELPNVRPNCFTFTSVISAFARSDDPCAYERADHYLNVMKKFAADGHTDCAPNEFTYSAVIKAWRKSSHQDSGRRVRELQRERDKLSKSTQKRRNNKIDSAS